MLDENSTSSQISSNPLKKNITANFAGTFWWALMSLLFIPLYIKYIGIESYGLIGIFNTLQIIFGLLDVGLGGTLTREMARLSVFPRMNQERRNLVRTLEVLYWSIAIIAGIAIVSISPFISHYWVKAGQLSPKTIEEAIGIMGFIIIFQMPVGFYSGGLMGLQKQVLLNVINVCIGTLRGVGAIFILWLVSPTIQAFLFWQLGISIIHSFLVALFLWRSLPRSENKAVFQLQLLKGIWRFTVGMSGISILGVILTQMDKIILSKLLPLEMFGYYSLASMVAMSPTRIFTPVFFSIYPRFTQLVSINDMDELKRLYHKSCQFIAVLILPITIVIALFSYEVILLWTQNAITAEKTHLIVSILICGTALNGLITPPYALQLAFGWTKLCVIKNIIAVIIMVPLIIFLAMQYGAVGASSAWVLLNIGYVIFEIPVMHRKILRKEMWRWYWQDVCLALVTSALVASFGRLLIQPPLSQEMMMFYLIIVSIFTFGIAVIVTPVTRTWILIQVFKR